MTDPDGFATIRFSTAGLPERERIALWREQYGYGILGIDIEPARDVAFEASLVCCALPELQLTSSNMSVVRITRTRELIADGNDDLALVVNRTGAVVASARGREVALGEGDAVLMTSSDVTTFDRHALGGSLSLRFPRSALSSLVVDVDDAVLTSIPRHSEALTLLKGYVGALLDQQALAMPELRRSVVTHVHDLIALSLGATGTGADLARSRGLRAVRLRSAKSYIIENCSNRDLSVGVVAAYLGVRSRSLQRLFEGDGTTFSAFLLGQRLARAHRMLTEPRLAHSAVGTIAYDVGFNDLSYFNRCFRQRYGAAPRDIREAAAT